MATVYYAARVLKIFHVTACSLFTPEHTVSGSSLVVEPWLDIPGCMHTFLMVMLLRTCHLPHTSRHVCNFSCALS